MGGFGHAAAFSFYPGKNLGAYGEGGALNTTDDAVAQLAREMRAQGESKRYFHNRVGYNYRMDGFQGAVLNVKLKHLDRWTARRQEFARLYRELEAKFAFPKTNRKQNRDAVREKLARGGVQTAVHYPVPVHLQEAYSHLGYKRGSLPHTEKACGEVLIMPLFPEMSREQVLYAAETLAEVVDELTPVR